MHSFFSKVSGSLLPTTGRRLTAVLCEPGFWHFAEISGAESLCKIGAFAQNHLQVRKNDEGKMQVRIVEASCGRRGNITQNVKLRGAFYLSELSLLQLRCAKVFQKKIIGCGCAYLSSLAYLRSSKRRGVFLSTLSNCYTAFDAKLFEDTTTLLSCCIVTY